MMTVEAPEVRIVGSARDARQLARDLDFVLAWLDGATPDAEAPARLRQLVQQINEAAA